MGTVLSAGAASGAGALGCTWAQTKSPSVGSKTSSLLCRKVRNLLGQCVNPDSVALSARPRTNDCRARRQALLPAICHSGAFSSSKSNSPSCKWIERSVGATKHERGGVWFCVFVRGQSPLCESCRLRSERARGPALRAYRNSRLCMLRMPAHTA